MIGEGKAAMSTPAPEVKYVKSTKVACDGDEGALGHPRVYLSMGDEGVVECGYCDRRFILEGGPEDDRSAGQAA